MTTQQAPHDPATDNRDPRPLVQRGIEQIDEHLAVLTTDQLDLPTPCDEWTVRDLVSHLVAVENRIVHIAGGGTPFEVPSMATGIADEDWYAAWSEHRTPLEQTLADDAILDAVFEHPAGRMPGRMALGIYASEFAVHLWDLAAALDADPSALDQQVPAALVEPLKRGLPADNRGEGVPFGPVIEVPAAAPPYDQLLGWLGRDPSWRANG